MFKKKNTIDGNKVGQNDNIKIGNSEIKTNEKSSSKIKQEIKDSTINNYNFSQTKIKDILNNKEKTENEKIYDFIEMINDLKFCNYELKQEIEKLNKMNELKNNVNKKYKEYKEKYETLKEKWDKKYEESFIILDKKNDNIIFEIKTYLKNILKEKYDELVHNINIVAREFDSNNRTIILINKNKMYGGEHDIDILLNNWLEMKEKAEKDDEEWATW